MNPTIAEIIQRIAHKIDPASKLLRIWSLEGGVSADVTGLEIELSDGHVQKMVVRRHGQNDLSLNPNIASREYNLLKEL